MQSFDPESVLIDLWEKLEGVNRMKVCSISHSKTQTGWNQKGKGDVLVVKEEDSRLLFHEKGIWQIPYGQDMQFTNVLRWTWDREKSLISLEHLRLGPSSPVFLFYLAPKGSHLLVSVDSHVCKEDLYSAEVKWDVDSVCLKYRVMGKRKNEEIECLYFSSDHLS